MSLGSNIKAIREKRGISLDSISSDLKVFKKYYKKIENGSEIPSDKLLIKISKVLGVPVNEIYSYNDNLDGSSISFKKQTSVIKDENYKDILTIKKRLITSEKFKSLKNKLNLVSVDKDLSINENEEVNKVYKTSSPSILNYVEPYEIQGVDKTLFYTEVNTGFEKGDRVFIINGNYDSNNLIEKSKYRGGRDGYKVLFIDKCKIVLDIDYTAIKPQKEFDISNALNIYKVNDEEDFLYINRQVVSNDNINFKSKFDLTTNNVIYTTKNFTGIPSSKWGYNSGINSGSGFYSKDNNGNWIKVTDKLLDGSIFKEIGISEIIVSDSNIKFNGSYIKKNKAYGFNSDNELTVLIDYNKPFISKSNFRGGNFKGEWNSGIFGHQEKEVKWDGDHAKWNLGTAINVNWKSGIMNTNYTLKESYISEFEGNKPYQKLNIDDNNGWGYNYLIDSEVNSINLNGCNIRNTNIGNHSEHSVVEKFASKSDYDTQVNLNKCSIEESHIKYSNIIESDVKNSITENTILDNIKSINSAYRKSVINNSKYINEEGIKILDYDELTTSLIPNLNTHTHKIYKFYIPKKSFNRIKKGEYFYINNLKIKDNNYPLNFFDKRFKIGNWTEFIESYNNDVGFIKRGMEFSCFLNSSNNAYSIDIITPLNDINSIPLKERSNTPLSELYKNGLDIEKPTGEYKKDKNGLLDISNAFINASDFDSGIVHKSDWVNGNHISINNDLNINLDYVKINRSRKVLEIKTTSINNKRDSDKNSILENDVIFLNNLYFKDENGLIKLPDSYKVINNDFQVTNKVTLEEIGNDNILEGIIENMQQDYQIINKDVDSRYNYLYRTKIDSCKISAGKFRRAFISNSFIENSEMDISNVSEELTNSKLVLSDIIFRNNNNILSNAIYLHSFLKGTSDELSDEYINGVVYRSIWDDMVFNNGIFKESSWLSGTFKKGYLVNNNTFNNNSTPNNPSFDDNNIKSYYLTGETSGDNYNNRLSWRSGIFENGEIYKTDWESGEFIDGIFSGSDFYNGTIKGGLIGSLGSSVYDTNIFGGVIENTTVINANLLSKNVNKQDNSLSSTIIWKNGIFNDGIFGTDESNINNESIWENGEFNGGQFKSNAKWKNGIFNGGEFISNLGYNDFESTDKDDYTWENGVFNDGVFGNGGLSKNSTWYNGEFNGGKFIGKVWNDGIFSFGQFLGSGDTAIGGNESEMSNEFVESYTSGNFYGLWRNGILTNKKDSFDINKDFYIKGSRKKERKKIKKAEFKNALWCNGTFKHSNGVIDNSVWLSGEFSKGDFINSSFNPFVKRPNQDQKSFDITDSCYWKSGIFDGGEFYISKWENGLFKSGDSYGMIWKNGISNYMNAYNIFWENGTWKNGNWYGSDIIYNGKVENEFDKAIINRGFEWMSLNNISNLSCHIWNIFDGGDQSGNKILSLRGKD